VASYRRAMATSDSREVTIEATPEEILDVIADVESTPTWSPQYQSAEILEKGKDGRPKRVKMKVKTAGISDEQVVDYTWADDIVRWTLVTAGQLKALSVPMPGFVLKRVMKGAMETATDGLRKQVLKVKKGS
jgi:hypothetical protein